MRHKEKIKKFVDKYIESNFNASEAMRGVSKAGKKAITVMATRYLQDDRVKKIIKEKLEQYQTGAVTKDLVLAGLLEIALDGKAKRSDRNRAYELLGKYLSLFKDKNIETNINIINEDTLNKIKIGRLEP